MDILRTIFILEEKQTIHSLTAVLAKKSDATYFELFVLVRPPALVCGSAECGPEDGALWSR